jgi:hypothetical protein
MRKHKAMSIYLIYRTIQKESATPGGYINQVTLSIINPMYMGQGARGGVVVTALSYKPAWSRVQFLMVSFEFFSDIILLAALWPASNRNEYQVYFLGVKAAST